jgi:hypothetical protein
MAIAAYQYIADNGDKCRVYLDSAKFQNGLTLTLLGLVVVDGTEKYAVYPSGSGRRRGVTARRVAFKNISTGKRVSYPVGKIADYGTLATTSVYEVTFKKGEVNNL